MLGITLIVFVCSYFGFYYSLFNYLPDLIGYSVLTNLFMISVYMNKKYCDATKLCVLSLIALNMFNLVSHGFNFYSTLYDVYLCAGIVCVLIGYKLKKIKNDTNAS